ncbi:MAG: cyclodeaminase/cyclohydrolase family protein [Synergistaceae bacterium]
MFEKMEIHAFIDELASNSPAPGGGSVAALTASLSSALVSMVANLTIGKEKYKENWGKMQEILEESEELRREFLSLMNKDTEAFNKYMEATKLPKETEEEKKIRTKAMLDATKNSTLIPLMTLETCAKVSFLANVATVYGNPNTASDAGSASALVEAAAKAASYNIRINLLGINDSMFAYECTKRMNSALESIKADCKKTEAEMNKKFA